MRRRWEHNSGWLAFSSTPAPPWSSNPAYSIQTPPPEPPRIISSSAELSHTVHMSLLGSCRRAWASERLQQQSGSRSLFSGLWIWMSFRWDGDCWRRSGWWRRRSWIKSSHEPKCLRKSEAKGSICLYNTQSLPNNDHVQYLQMLEIYIRSVQYMAHVLHLRLWHFFLNKSLLQKTNRQ